MPVKHYVKIRGHYLCAGCKLSSRKFNIMKFSSALDALEYVRENFPIAFGDGAFLIANTAS